MLVELNVSNNALLVFNQFDPFVTINYQVKEQVL